MILQSTFARALALLWLSCCLSGCGGGRDDGATDAPLSAAQELASRAGRMAVAAGTDVGQLTRRRALAQTASEEISAETVALFDFGEANFKQYFPSHQANRVIGSLAYRFYPETGAYLFVDTASQIYVVGGPFGNDLTFVGVVGDYVKPQASDFLLRVARSGIGTGSVGSSTGGISCGTSCSAVYSAGTSVTLTATPTAGSTFAGWSGACSGAATTCNVTMDAAKDVTASFALPSRFTLSVVVEGTGNGVVVASTGGFSCGSACSATFSAGSSVTLIAVPTGGSTFTGWTGACSGTAVTCSVTMDAAKSITATFSEPAGSNG